MDGNANTSSPRIAEKSRRKPPENGHDDNEGAAETATLREWFTSPGGGRLSVRSMNFGMPTNMGAQQHVHEREGGSHTLAYKVLDTLHSHTSQVILSSLLLLDVIILFVELFLLATYPPCHAIERDAISCCDEHNHTDDHLRRWLAGGGDDHGLCEVGEVSPLEATCDDHKWEAVHTIEEVLFGLTIAILSLFFVELNVTMICLRPQIFFRQFWYLLDYLIVTVSLTLELTYHFLESQNAATLAGFLVIGRIWRFVRIGHGILEVTHELAHEQHQKLLAYAEDLEELLEANQIEIPPEIKLPHRHKKDDILSRIEYEHRHHSKKHHKSSQLAASGNSSGTGEENDDDKISSDDDPVPTTASY